MRTTPIRALRAVPALLIALAACSTAHEARTTADGKEVAALPPLPYRVDVEVAQGNLLGGSQDADKLHFALDARAFQERIEQTLRDDCALASAVSSGSGDEARPADLRLRIAVEQRPNLTYEGTTSNNVAAVGLWLFTIFGGSFVEDCRYQVHMPMNCDLVDPRTNEVLYQFTADPKYVDTKYWDRVTVPGGLLWALSCVPHCLVSDNVEVTSQSLSTKGTELLAFAIAEHLKGTFEQAAAGRLGRVEFASPRNGARVSSGNLRLDCTIRTENPLRELQVHLDSRSARALLHLQEADLQPKTRWEAGGYVTKIDCPLDVSEHPFRRGGVNFLHVRIKAGSIDAWRTLRLVLD